MVKLHSKTEEPTSLKQRNTHYTFNHTDQIVSVIPPPDTGAPAQTTTSYLDSRGRATNTVQPDGTSVQNAFSLRGEFVLASGSRTYPAGYGYEPHDG